MPSQPALPPLIAPHISASSRPSFTLISSVLSATGNWLVLRFLYAVLSPGSGSGAGLEVNMGDHAKPRKVILVSFLRGLEFWKSEAKRLGIDLSRLADKKQFAYVNGLAELFGGPGMAAASPAAISNPAGNEPSRTVLPIRSQPGPAPPRASVPVSSGPEPSHSISSSGTTSEKRLHLRGSGNAALDALEQDILAVIDSLRRTERDEAEPAECLLILDQPDFLLAATGPELGISAATLSEWAMGLQERVDSLVMTVSADSPLIHNASSFSTIQPTALEKEHAAFVISSAHRAQMVMQLRNLETGPAKDVSGVFRISRGGSWEASEGKQIENDWEERELLYFVQRDGGVRVFGRGE